VRCSFSVTVGSNSNVGERGLEVEERRAAILEVDAAIAATTVFASGLRNPNGLAWEPQAGAVYGWPYSYYGQYVDRVSSLLRSSRRRACPTTSSERIRLRSDSRFTKATCWPNILVSRITPSGAAQNSLGR
jgi:glucose/arabinose dehydrogenase